MAKFGVGLAHIQRALCGGPVVGGLQAVGEHQRVLGACSVVGLVLLGEFGFDVGIDFIAQATHRATYRACGGQVRAAMAGTRSVAHESRTGIAAEAEAIA